MRLISRKKVSLPHNKPPFRLFLSLSVNPLISLIFFNKFSFNKLLMLTFAQLY